MAGEWRRVVALSGGVGGARLADGLQQLLDPGALTVIVNTGDDFRHCGLAISPDVDTVLYTLAGLANPATGWGRAGDGSAAMGALVRLGGPTWFHLGDEDLATHLARSAWLAEGRTPTEVTRRLARGLGVPSTVLPATDAALATVIETREGPLAFQDWFVRRGCRPPAVGLRFAGAGVAAPTPEALAALAEAEAILIGPSNPYLSLGPMLAMPAFRAALEAAPAPRIAVSPVVAGRALKGPTAEMLRDLGGGASVLDLARHYLGLLDGLLIDAADEVLAGAVRDLGLAVRVTDIVVPTAAERRRLALEALAFASSLGGREQGP